MSQALVVGCSAYEDPDIAPLRFAHRDAQRIAEVLRRTCGVDEADLVVLHDDLPPAQRPTRTTVLRHLTRMSKSRNDGILYFFFSGHGFQSADNTQYLLPIDCVRDAIEETALPFSSIVRYLGSAAAPHVVLFLDACRNVVDGGKSAGADLSRVDIDALCPPGVVSFCSCRPGAVSYEAETLGAGIFTQALCAALSDDGRCRTIYELDTYLAAQVPALARANGKPHQQAHSRVEPLGVQHLEIVSERTVNAWRASTPIGVERRRRLVNRLVEPGSVHDPLIAVDFGTSYSVVSWCRPDGEVVLLPGPDGRPLVPSVVHFLPDLDYLVGSAAVEADPYRSTATIRHVKRTLGSTHNYEIDGRSLSPELVVGLIVRSLRRNAEEALGTPVRRCIASHPANFTLRQIEALGRAFTLGGLDVFRMVGEPNVAALLTDMTMEPGESSRCLVIDLGGGTFDVALVEGGEGVAEIRSSTGSNSVGGLDFDDALVAFAENELRRAHGWSDAFLAGLRDRLRREAERAKRDLGYRDSTTILLQDVEDGTRGFVDVSIGLDRASFRTITSGLNNLIRTTIENAFTRLDFGEKIPDWIAGGGTVLLAGQGTKIFTVREQLEAVLPGVPLRSGYQETAVAHGMAMQAGVLTGLRTDLLLLNALQFGLAVILYRLGKRGDADRTAVSAEVLLSPSTTIPTKRSETLKLPGPAGTRYELEIVEAPLAADLAFGRVELVSSGSDIELIIDVDANGIIVLRTSDLRTGATTAHQVNQLDRQAQYAAAAVSPIAAPRRERHGITSADAVNQAR